MVVLLLIPITVGELSLMVDYHGIGVPNPL
jgi:hypothetical protein